LLSNNFFYHFLNSFRKSITLKEPDVSKSGNSENSIKLVRSWENPRYGFRTTKGLQGHLKLYQKMEYLDKYKLTQKFFTQISI